jgi:glutathione S-transferase
MVTIYGVLRSRASRNVWLLNELGIPYEVKPVIQAYRLLDRPPGLPPMNTRSPEFLRLNRLGQIPVMVDDGLVLTESLAINLYLARKYGVDRGIGPISVEEEGLAAMWTLRAAKEFEDRTLDLLMHRVSLPEEERDPVVAANAEAVLRDRFPIIDTALAGSGWLMGDRFTVVDINVAEVLRYAMPAQSLFDDNPNIKAWIEACHARPAFQKMWAARNAEPA